MKLIILTRGKVALVDDDQYEALARYKWHVINPGADRWYAQRTAKIEDHPKGILTKCVYMHRQILGHPPSKVEIDHIDGNGLNNQRSNLRFANRSQNSMNSRKRKGRYGFIGVEFHQGKYRAYARIDGQKKHLGSFDTPELAAKKRDDVVLDQQEGFALLNF